MSTPLDTSPAMEEMQRTVLMTRPGLERLRMACAMWSTARALMVARIKAVNPDVSSGEIRCELFRRTYAHELDPETLARAAARLSEDPPS